MIKSLREINDEFHAGTPNARAPTREAPPSSGDVAEGLSESFEADAKPAPVPEAPSRPRAPLKIKSLTGIGEEFYAELTSVAAPAQDAQPADGPGDAEVSVSPSEADAKALPGRKGPRPRLRQIVSIAIAIIAIILIIVAVNLVVKGMPARGDISSDGENGIKTGDESGGSAAALPEGDEAGGGAAALPGSQEADADDILPDTGAYLSSPRIDVAALYVHIVGFDRIEDADMDESAADALPERKRSLIERIETHFSDGAYNDAPPLSSETEIDADPAFKRLTEQADALADAIGTGLAARDRLHEVIDLRREAHELYPEHALTMRLAIDYEDLGVYCIEAGQPEGEAVDAFINEIRYRVEYMNGLPAESEDRRAEIRSIADTYIAIAQISLPDTDRKWHAAFIADCLYALAAR
jgi:hypothetical protein